MATMMGSMVFLVFFSNIPKRPLNLIYNPKYILSEVVNAHLVNHTKKQFILAKPKTIFLTTENVSLHNNYI